MLTFSFRVCVYICIMYVCMYVHLYIPREREVRVVVVSSHVFVFFNTKLIFLCRYVQRLCMYILQTD